MTARDCVAIMGMPVAVHVVDARAGIADVEAAFDYLRLVDSVFSTYRPDSETERLNSGELATDEASEDMRLVLGLCERTRIQSDGYFDARYRGPLDPSGVVKGFAILGAADLLRGRGFSSFVVDAGGDIQTCGTNLAGQKWRIGIQDPFEPTRLVSVVYLSGQGVATSGTYARGAHIYDPVHGRPATGVASMSVIARDVCEADRFATAAFAMGEQGIVFLEKLPGIEGLMVRLDGSMYCTTSFPGYMRK